MLPKLAYAQRLIASLSLILLRQRDATGLIVFDDEVRSVTPPRARAAHWRQLLATLAATKAGQGTAAAPALKRVVDTLRRRGLVVFVSDLLLDRDLALTALRFLRHRGHQVVVLHLMDPAEVTLVGPGRGALRGSGDAGRPWCSARVTGPRPTIARCGVRCPTGTRPAGAAASSTIAS